MSVVDHGDPTPGPATTARRLLPGGRELRDGRHVYWWAELLACLVFYLVYSGVRNLHHGNAAEAFQHARELIDLQKTLGINVEESIQNWALGVRPLILFANYFYGSLHFIATAGTMIYLFRRWTNDYPLWRNTLATATALALIGFALFPLMPPRMLPAQCDTHPALHCKGEFSYEDTLAKDPAFWSFNSGAVNKISNQFAAMPSVHCAWAMWCACALVPRLRRRWAKLLAALYPVATVTAIVVSANHYLLDAVAGFTVLALGYLTARAFTRAGRGPAVISRVSAPSASSPLAERPG
ncbi:MAG: phosphatase PAP2 family protein [Acidimicrobiia bacterium]